MKVDVTGGIVDSDVIISCLTPIHRDHKFLLKAYPNIVHAQYIGRKYGLVFKSTVKSFKDITYYREAIWYSWLNDFDKRDVLRNELSFMNKMLKLAGSVHEIYITADDMTTLYDMIQRRNKEKMEGTTHAPFFY